MMGTHMPDVGLKPRLEKSKKKEGGAVLAGRFGRIIVREGSVSASTGGGGLASGRNAALGIRLRSGEGWKVVQDIHTLPTDVVLDNKMC